MECSGVASLARRADGVVSGILGAVVTGADRVDALIRRSDRSGVDVQSNAALSLAATTRTAPRQLAERIVEGLVGTRFPATATVAGPGFVNLAFAGAAIWEQVAARLGDERLGVGRPQAGVRTIVDYCGVNVAKEMHVGHLRTTIIGDSLVRVLSHLGGEVVRENHLGDWGTQFGMLIQYLDEHPDAAWHADQLDAATSSVSALDLLYRQARAAFDADDGFAERARRRVVALQAGDAGTVVRWREIVAESENAFQDVYRRLGVLLTGRDSVGESTYNAMLPEITDELLRAGIAVESHGALCVFDPAITGRDGAPVPLIVRKTDGGYGYAATDLAALRHRVREQQPDRILYVVDARQALHFRQVFAAARRAGWLPEAVRVEHVAFGAVLGADGRPFKTRDGGTVRLSGLLDEAVSEARRVVTDKNPELGDGAADAIAETCGIGAVKYAELSTSRLTDYRFDPDTMVAFSGNTGVYLMYAHARICSILRKAGGGTESIDPGVAVAPAERRLALALDGFADVLCDVADGLEPHRLCGYLYELARSFTAFYEACPVLAAEPRVRANRVGLCRLTRRTLGDGLALLGIAAPERL